MTEQEYVARRMDRALDKAFDIAESKAEERGVMVPPDIVGQMALQIFQARFTLAMSKVDEADLPDDVAWGVQ